MISNDKIKKFNKELEERKLTIFCGESITAGLFASTIASISGASLILKGSVVTYDKNLKISILGVSPDIIKEYTAESQETTTAMCYGLQKLYPFAAIYVAVTGVASFPATNDYIIDKEVGQIYVSIYYNHIYEFNTIIKSTSQNDPRNEIRDLTVEYIMEKILEVIS